MTAVVTGVVWCGQLLQRDGSLLVFDGLRAPFSQVNDDLRYTFPSSRAQPFLSDSDS
jgi:hypothetical protein